MKVYLDHASTTKTIEEAVDAMNKCFSDNYGNANSSHNFGRRAVSAVDEAREKIARIIGAKPKEIFFTSGGTEADNWALKGLWLANLGKKNKLIVSAEEHSAIIETANTLKSLGVNVEFVYPSSDGIIEPKKIEDLIDDQTFLVSVMFVNNETGVTNDIKEIASVCHKNGVLFHSDCVQATCSKKLSVGDLGVDLMTVSAHKIGGPKGIGFLFVKEGVVIRPLVEGGSQESGLRGGTTNVPSVVGFAVAMEKNDKDFEKRVNKLVALRDYFERELAKTGLDIVVNGKNRIPSISNVTFRGVLATVLLTRLDMLGIAVSAGSACTAGSIDASHVLLSMGINEKDAKSSLRFSFGEENTFEEIDFVIKALKDICVELTNK